MHVARLNVLGDWYSVYQTALRAGLPDKQANYYAQGLWSGQDPLQCLARGGIVSARIVEPLPGGFDWSQPHAYFACGYPAAPPSPSAPAPAPVNVTTNTQTTVSPQISPNLVQQQDPTNSPVEAGTAQASPAPQSAATQVSAPAPAPQSSAPSSASYPYLDYGAAPATDPATTAPVNAGFAPSGVSSQTSLILLALAVAGVALLASGRDGAQQRK